MVCDDPRQLIRMRCTNVCPGARSTRRSIAQLAQAPHAAHVNCTAGSGTEVKLIIPRGGGTEGRKLPRWRRMHKRQVSGREVTKGGDESAVRSWRDTAIATSLSSPAANQGLAHHVAMIIVCANPEHRVCPRLRFALQNTLSRIIFKVYTQGLYTRFIHKVYTQGSKPHLVGLAASVGMSAERFGSAPYRHSITGCG